MTLKSAGRRDRAWLLGRPDSSPGLRDRSSPARPSSLPTHPRSSTHPDPRLPRSNKVRSCCPYRPARQVIPVLTVLSNLCPSARSDPPRPLLAPPTFRHSLPLQPNPSLRPAFSLPPNRLPTVFQSRWPKLLPPRTPCGSSVSRSSSSVRPKPSQPSDLCRSHPTRQSTRRSQDRTRRGK